MSDSKPIMPVEQRDIQFHGDVVTAVLAPDGTVYVPVRPLCDLLGVDWAGQFTKMKNDAVLSTVSMSVQITGQTSDPSSRRPKTTNMIALPLDYLNGWLFSINANRVKESVRENLIRYQLDCYRVLFEAFGRNEVTVRRDDELMQSEDPSAVSFRTLMQMAKLARETYYLTKQVEEHETRIGLLEAKLGEPDRFISESQAQQIAGAVKAIALKLGDTSKKNEFGGVYGALYSRFGITSYKRLPAERFETVMEWFREWWKRVANDTTPF